MNRASLALLVTLVLIAACSGGAAGDQRTWRPEPPKDTGVVDIDMRGTWVVVDVHPLEVSAPIQQPRASSSEASLWPPVLGTEVRMDRGGVLRAAGRSLRIEDMELEYTVVDDYQNLVDGRVAWYRFKSHTRPDAPIADGGSGDVMLIAGSVDHDHMLAAVRVDSSGLGGRLFGAWLVTLELRAR
jgi:hypothetical protein